jgi:hypothetical protein
VQLLPGGRPRCYPDPRSISHPSSLGQHRVTTIHLHPSSVHVFGLLQAQVHVNLIGVQRLLPTLWDSILQSFGTHTYTLQPSQTHSVLLVVHSHIAVREASLLVPLRKATHHVALRKATHYVTLREAILRVRFSNRANNATYLQLCGRGVHRLHQVPRRLQGKIAFSSPVMVIP